MWRGQSNIWLVPKQSQAKRSSLMAGQHLVRSERDVMFLDHFANQDDTLMNALVADMVITDPVEQRLLERSSDVRKIFFRNLHGRYPHGGPCA
jgi:hypothetical protein